MSAILYYIIAFSVVFGIGAFVDMFINNLNWWV